MAELRICFDEVGGTFADHHAGEIGIGVGNGRHDRSVADPEVIHKLLKGEKIATLQETQEF